MLAVDIGNTNTCFARFADDRIIDRWTLPTAGLEPAAVVDALSAAASGNGGKRLWIASVAPRATAIVAECAGRAGLEARIIVPGADAIIPHRLRTPETTGVDRLLAALAAGGRLGGARDYLVVQCGSAATVDLVEGGVFRGGFILPGPAMWLSAMGRAAQLPDLSASEIEWDEAGPGASTREALLRGAAAGLPGAISGAALALRGNASLPALVTGGWGERIAGRLGFPATFSPDLVLRGIRLFAERQR